MNSNNLQEVPAGGGADTPLPTFAPGTITVSARINVSFLLEQ